MTRRFAQLGAVAVVAAGVLALPANAALADPTPAPSTSTAATPSAAPAAGSDAPSAAPSSAPGTGDTAQPAALTGHNPTGALERGRVGTGGAGATINVTGWAADPDSDAAVGIDVYVDGGYAGSLTADGARADIGTRYGIGANHGFSGLVPATVGAHRVCVYAINIGAGDGNPQLGCAPVTVTNNPFGWLDGVSQSPSGLHVRGWGVDANTTDPLLVDVWSGSSFLGELSANATRTDVGAYTGMGDQHGFDGALPVNTVLSSPVCVYLINTGPGATVLLGCLPVVYRSAPFGWFDYARQAPGGVHVRGWAIDPGTSGPDLVDFWSGSTFVGEISASTTRTDVENAFPGWGADHGFDQVLPTAGLSAPVCAYMINRSKPTGGNPSLGCIPVTIGTTPFGFLDSAGPAEVDGTEKLSVAGWTIDPDTDDPISVHVYVNGAKVGETVANGNRPDLQAYFPDYSGNHAYSATFDAPSGTDQVCVYAINVQNGAGSNPTLGCRTVTINNNPVGALTTVAQVSGGVHVVGWALDPNTTAPIEVDLWSGSTFVKAVQADQPNADGAKAYPAFGNNHGFDAVVAAPSGSFAICAYAINVAAGTGNPAVGCKTIATNFDPFGAVDSVSRTAPGQVTITGWAIDPDSTAPIQVNPVIDGTAGAALTASAVRNDVAAAYPGFGAAHGFSVTVPVTDAEHTVCVNGLNVGLGSNKLVGSCLDLPDKNAVAPSGPRNFAATPNYGSAVLTWDAPASTGGAAIIDYTVTVSPGGQSTVLGADGRQTLFLGLAWNSTYTFTIVARNAVGRSAAVTSNAITTFNGPPPQTTTPPVSTSRYMRNVSGAPSDLDYWRAAGANDAAANLSGHQYLSLIDIGGQTNGGVLLSAVSKFVSYGRLVQVLDAYVDGYASAMKPEAPAVIALGTNNDVIVNAGSGADWANQVVNPVVNYASRYPGIIIAGANDIEPGFRGSVAATKDWLSGFLGASTALFINNGSADGCSQTGPNGGCNNGWTAADIYYLSKGAAPARMTALPQIYYTSQARQWKWISITGPQRIDFFGILSEVQACAQAGGSCYSMSGADAWNTFWNLLKADNRSAVGSLPTATDLRIN